MIAPDIQLVKDKDNELLFSFRYKVGLFYSVLGAAIIYFCVSAAGALLIVRFVFGLFGLVIALIGFFGLFKRFELKVNLSAQTYRISKGLWPTIRVTRGSLNELNNVTLTTRAELSENSNYDRPVWVISLNFRKWSGPISIFESYNELQAQNKLHYWEKRLSTQSFDLTKKATQAAPFKNDQASDNRPPAAPPKKVPSGFELYSSGGIVTIVLPPRRITFRPVLESIMIVLLCSGLTSFAFLFVFSESAHRSKTTPLWLFYSLSILFLAAAAYMFLGSMKNTWGRPIITLDSNGLIHGIKIFGRVWGEVRLRRQEIKEISIRKYSGVTRELESVTIMGERVLINIGQTLQQGQMEWLCEELRHKFGLSIGQT